MKRIFALLISAIMIVSLFAACGQGGGTSSSDGGNTSSSSGGGKTTVEFWGHVNEAWNASHRDIVGRFNASQSEIEVVPTFFPYDDFEAKIQTSLMAGGAGADIYEIWGGWGLDFVATDALSPVPDAVIKELIADSYEPVLGTFKKGDTYYGVPVEYNNEYGGMLVNKVEFDKLGIPYPETWDEIVNVARQTSVSNGPVFEMRGLDFTTDDTLTHTFLTTILSTGGQYWVNDKFDFSTPQATQALQMLVDLIVVDNVTNLDSATGAQGAEIDGAHFLGRGEAMMVPRGPWVISMLEEEYDKAEGVDFEFVKFPIYGPTKAFTAETGWSMCVPKNTQVAEAAWEYLDFFLDKENLMEHNVRCAQIPPLKSIAKDPEFAKQLPFVVPLLDILDAGRFIGPFNTDVLKIGLRNVFVSLCTQDGTYASVSEALTSLENELNTTLKLG
ncbi:MAG: extracellular solute-binding protein [Oscillospiraceae bacterium]|nr:extracellular solute-binding protein [Oscillospiraceae bacterium]